MKALPTVHRIAQPAEFRLPPGCRTDPAVARNAAICDGVPVGALPAPLLDLVLLFGVHLRRSGNPRLLRPTRRLWVRWQMQTDQGEHPAFECLRAPLNPVCILSKEALRKSLNFGFQGNSQRPRCRGACRGVGLGAGFVGGAALDIIRGAQRASPEFWDGFVTGYSLNSRMAVAVPIFRSLAIWRQLRPWSRSCFTAAPLTMHLGRPLFALRPSQGQASGIAGSVMSHRQPVTGNRRNSSTAATA